MYLLLSFSPSFYACFSSSLFSVTKVSFVHSIPFPPPSLSCLCNRLYILPHVLNLSLLPLCQFLLCLVFRFPIARLASHMRSYFILHLLSHIHSIHCCLAKLILHAQWCCLSTGLALHTHSAFLSALFMYMCRICIFGGLGMHPKIQDLYTCTASFQFSDSYLVIHNK